MKTIFVSIASYRDPDVNNTISDLFSKAKHVGRVFVGTLLQIDLEVDKDCAVIPTHNVRVSTVPPEFAKGCAWARAVIQQSLYGDEDFYFQVDSHMRFEQDWDEKLISMYEQLPEKSVISTYPLPFTPPSTFNPPRLVRIRPKKFDVDGVLLQTSGMFPLDESKPMEKTPFIAGGLLFMSRQAVYDVPIDKHIFFTGEEITTGLRLFTHGYDVYIPNKVVAYHNYNLAPERPRVWIDQESKNKRSALSRARVLWMCGQKETVESDALKEIDRYGNGTVRTIQEFEEFANVNFKDRTICGK